MKELRFFVTAQDLEEYANLSGDYNPLHLDKKYAEKHGYTGQIVHGMLTMAKVWHVLSNGLLASSDIPKNYDLAFLSPVYVGDEIILQIKRTANGFDIVGMCSRRTVIKGFIIM